VRVIGLIILAAVLHTAVFAQKPLDPEARNKRAVSIPPTRPANSVQTHRSRSAATSVPKPPSSSARASSARDLAKIERTSVQQIKTPRKKNVSSKPGPQVVSGTQPQTKSKPMKFSYQPPKAAGKTSSAKNPRPPSIPSRP
jgi:hypothetical protein